MLLPCEHNLVILAYPTVIIHPTSLSEFTVTAQTCRKKYNSNYTFDKQIGTNNLNLYQLSVQFNIQYP